MKKTIIALTVILLVCATIYAIEAESFSLTPAVTEIAASSTNSTAGTIKKLSQGETPIRFYLSCNGNASAAGAFKVKLSTASGSGNSITNNFDTPSESNVYLVITNALTATTTTVSDWFVLSGAKYVRIGQIENTKTGPVSNIVVNIGYSNDQ